MKAEVVEFDNEIRLEKRKKTPDNQRKRPLKKVAEQEVEKELKNAKEAQRIEQ